jgi:hypothetical protein
MELSWSRWFRCESSFELLLVPDLPGIFAMAEEVLPAAGSCSRRMLAVFEVDEADRLVQSLSRLFAVGSPWRPRLQAAKCYLRYAVVGDREKRRSATEALRNWLNSQREVAGQVFGHVEAPELQEEAATIAERAVDRVLAATPRAI